MLAQRSRQTQRRAGLINLCDDPCFIYRLSFASMFFPPAMWDALILSYFYFSIFFIHNWLPLHKHKFQLSYFLYYKCFTQHTPHMLYINVIHLIYILYITHNTLFNMHIYNKDTMRITQHTHYIRYFFTTGLLEVL